MARVNHDIDTKADTVIILRNANASFAPWSFAEVGRDAVAIVDNFAIDESAVNESAVNESAVNEPTSGIADQEAHIQVTHAANCSSETNPTDHCTEGDEIWYYVSRQHLTSASPTFERMFSGMNWKECTRNEDDGLYHVPAEDWDSEALLYVLQVLHLRNRQVPRTVSLEMLAKITVIIDFYECAEALELFTERWVEHLQAISPAPSIFCRDLMLWMCIAWVLRLSKTFVQTTTIAIRHDGQDLPTLGLPIMICVERIEESRRQAMGTIFSQLQVLLQEFRSPLYQCPRGDSFECGSILYGALTKEMELQGLLPIPIAPYSGLSFSELYTKMQRIRSPRWCRPDKHKRGPHPCDLGAKVMEIVEPVTLLPNGLELKDFEFH